MTHAATTLSAHYLNTSAQLFRSPGVFFERLRDNDADTGFAVRFW